MVNYLLVGYGARNRIAFFAQKVCDDLRDRLSKLNTHVYDLNTLTFAECDKRFLKRKSRLSFPAPARRDLDKIYWIMMGEPDYDELYERWFSAPSSSMNDRLRYFIPFPAVGDTRYAVPYSSERLADALNRLFPADPVAEKEPQSSGIADMTLKYSFQEVALKTFCCRITFCVTDEAAAAWDPVNDFQKHIACLDEEFPDVFSSAYITNGTEFHPVRNLAFCNRYEPDTLGERILGAEYAVYVSDRLAEISADAAAARYRVEKLAHGRRYTFDGSLQEFDGSAYQKAAEFFGGLTVPAYVNQPWESLCASHDSYSQVPEMLSVYHDPSDVHGSPLLLFSCGYTAEQMDRIAALHVGGYPITDASRAPTLMERYRAAQGRGYDAVGRTDEQHPQPCGGGRDEGVCL